MIPLPDRLAGWPSIVRAYLEVPREHGTMALAVVCRLGEQVGDELALWDTGASWSVMGPETARLLGPALGAPSGRLAVQTRHGRFAGRLHRVQVFIPSLVGIDFRTEAAFLVLDDPWPGPVVLGVRGFMEHLRFLLDPGANADAQALMALEPAG